MKNNAKFLLDPRIYPLDAIYGTSYSFVDRVYIYLDYIKNKIEVSLTAKDDSGNLKKIEGEFMNELLNYTIRVNLSAENKQIRQYIVEQALFSAVNFGEEKIEEFTYEDDPLGIAIPWEEKYGKKDTETNTKTEIKPNKKEKNGQKRKKA